MVARRVVDETDFDRVSTRLLEFVFELLRHAGADPGAFADTRPSIGRDPGPWVAWDDYIAMIHHLGDVAGGAPGVAAAMRAVAPTAYAPLRAQTGFFAGPIPFFSFVSHHLNRELVPGATGDITEPSPVRFRATYRIDDRLTPSRLYLQGTVTLTEIFPTHFDLPEGTVQVLALTDRTADMIVEFPSQSPRLAWGTHLDLGAPTTSSLTNREQEVLRLVCGGLTNAQIASTLGTAASTVKTQISSILSKMDVVNRTELAALVSRRS